MSNILISLQILYGTLFCVTQLSHCQQCSHDGGQLDQGLEMFYDYNSCSTVIDWSKSVADSCRGDIGGFEVQITNGCINTSVNVNFSDDATELSYSFEEYAPGKCLAEESCYARIKSQREDSPSSWIGVSNTSSITEGILHA